MSSWQPLGGIDPKQLTEGRLQLHYALQPLTAVAVSLLEKRPDWSHGSLDYDAAARSFRGQPLAQGQRAALAVDDLRLGLLDSGGGTIATLSLFGHSLAEGVDWIKQVLAEQGRDLSGFHEQKFDDFPEHALGSGANFDSAARGAIQEVAAYFENTQTYLDDLVAREKRASPVRVWPHHCDMATLITIKEPSEPGGEDGQSVGVGFSPGDGGTPEPYWYVTPWPYPDPATLPALQAGRWNTDGWVGAVLVGSELSKEVDTQREQVNGFLNTAVQALLSP